MATTSTEMRCRLNASKTVARNPYWPIMRVEMMSTSVTLALSTMEVMSTSDMSRVDEMTEPGAVLQAGRG